MRMQEHAALEALQELGLTRSEAKIYLALLASSPANGNQISRSAGVPSAKVYENLERLCDRGLIAMIDDARYVPLDFEEFLQERQARLKEVGTLLRETVMQKIHDVHGEILWQGKGYTALLERASRLVDLAQEELLMSLWPTEMPHIAEAAERALKRGVHVAIMIFATPAEIVSLLHPLAQHENLHVFTHAMLPTIHARHGNQAAFVADDTATLLMSGASSHEWLGVWTSNPAVVRTVANYIRHDIYINKVYASGYEELSRQYGRHLERLLDVREGGVSLREFQLENF
jgi:sugar-specific transcriptional regulator TrmB